MTTQQAEAWKKVRYTGTVNLIAGILSLVGFVFLVIISIFLIVANFDIPSDDPGEAPLPSAVLGIIFLVISIFILPIAIVDIIAGVKLRKPIAKPKGWLIYTIVIGALSMGGLGGIMGILQLIFAILALSSSHELDNSNPPAQLK